jgi:Regulator of chromosome condensation (RCC1) repeat
MRNFKYAPLALGLTCCVAVYACGSSDTTNKSDAGGGSTGFDEGGAPAAGDANTNQSGAGPSEAAGEPNAAGAAGAPSSSTGEPAGSAGESGAGPGSAGGGSGGMTGDCGAVGQTCCANSCNQDLLCLAQTSCSCAQALFGTYLLRGDGELLLEAGGGAAGAQTPVVDAATGLPLTHIVDVEDGSYYGCALLADKTVSCWRTSSPLGNQYGQLGNGTADTNGSVLRATPVLTAASTPLTNVKAMALGKAATPCAITNDGKLYCWGDLSWAVNKGTALYSGYAQAITTDGAVPLTSLLQASTNGYTTCAIVAGATANEVWCWGYNGRYNLGLGDTVTRQYPTRVLGLTNPTKVAVGQYNFNIGQFATCALDGGSVRCWGYNGYGQTGTTLVSPVTSPTSVVVQNATVLSQVVDLYMGNTAMCALRTGNTLWCWGQGFSGYAANYGVTNVVTAGWMGGNAIDMRFLTSDGAYHVSGASRSPNCGVL